MITNICRALKCHFMQIYSAFISLLHGNRRTDSHGEVNRHIFQLDFVKRSKC